MEEIGLDLNSKTDYILSLNKEDIDFIYQKEHMNSKAINDNFALIEKSLNNMYEKIRVLEDVISYTQVYVDNEIDRTVTECRDILHDIENITDANGSENNDYISINVPFIVDTSNKYIDRDGSTLKACSLYNNILSINGTIKNNIEIDGIEFKRSEQVYEHNEEAFRNGKSYRTKYILDEIIDTGVYEIATFKFKEPQNINSIEIKLSNCKLKNIIYIYQDGNEQYETNISTSVTPNKILKAIKIEFFSLSYEVIEEEAKVNTTNFFDSLRLRIFENSETIKQREEKRRGYVLW